MVGVGLHRSIWFADGLDRHRRSLFTPHIEDENMTKQNHLCWTLAGWLALGLLPCDRAFAASGDDDFAAELLATQKGYVYEDPKSGALSLHPMTPEQQAISPTVYAMLKAETPYLPLRVLPKGEITILLDDRYQENMSVTTQPDGTQVQACGTHAHQDAATGTASGGKSKRANLTKAQ